MPKLLLTFLLITGIHFNGDNNIVYQQLFTKGVSDLKNGNYLQAVNKFKTLQNNGIRRPAIYCNLGNAYFKEGEFGEAMLIYTQGLMTYPFDKQLIHNRDILNARLNLSQQNYSTFNMVNNIWLVRFLNEGAIAGVILLFVGSIIYLTSFFYGRHKGLLRKLYTYSVIISITMLTLTTCFLLFMMLSTGAVILNNSVSRAGPSKLAKTACEFKTGENVLVVNYFDGWYKVKNNDGTEGWLPVTSIGLIRQ